MSGKQARQGTEGDQGPGAGRHCQARPSVLLVDRRRTGSRFGAEIASTARDVKQIKPFGEEILFIPDEHGLIRKRQCAAVEKAASADRLA